MSENDIDEIGWRGNIGPELKSEYTWNNEGNGTNSSGFNGKAHGSASFNNSGVMYSWAGEYPVWWTSTPAPVEFDPNPQAWFRGLDDINNGVNRDGYDYVYLRAIRCLKNGDNGLDYDGNGDGCVDVNDMLDLLLEYGQCEPESQLDFDGNGDGCVNGEDVLNILVEYGSCE